MNRKSVLATSARQDCGHQNVQRGVQVKPPGPHTPPHTHRSTLYLGRTTIWIPSTA